MPPTIRDGSFEWDAAKDHANQRRHGVSFPEAATTLAHPQTAIFEDGGPDGRLKAVGMSVRGRVLTVVFEVRGERERIVSAWKATPQERRLYMSGGA